MGILLRLLVSAGCELLTLWVFKHFHQVDRSCIIELGYRSSSKNFKKPSKSTPLWDRILHWSLCKEAKKMKASVWLYFLCNLIVVIAAIGSVILACVLIFFAEIREILLYQLMCLFGTVFVWIGLHFFLDIFLLPSEQKRRGVKSKK